MAYFYRNRHYPISKQAVAAMLCMVVYLIPLYLIERDLPSQYDAISIELALVCGCCYLMILFTDEQGDIGEIFLRGLSWFGLISSLIIMIGFYYYYKGSGYLDLFSD